MCIYVSLFTHTHKHTHTYLHTCTYIMHTYPGMNSAWADNLSPSKCLQQATLYQHQAWVSAAPELCQYLHFHSMSTTSWAHLEWEVWLRLPLRGGDWTGCQGYSGAATLCLLSGVRYWLQGCVFTVSSCVFTICTLFCVQWSMSIKMFIVVVQAFSCVQPFATPWIAALQASLSFTISQSLL